MGTKGDRRSAAADEQAAALVEDWGSLGPVTSKKMFGGFGIFHDGTMFAIVDSGGGIFLKADERSIAEHESAGGTKHGRMPYWSLPDAVGVADDEGHRWARRAIEIATGG